MEKDERLIELGLKIKLARKLRDMNQTELAYKCEMEKSSLSKIESGQVNSSVLTLFKIITALELTPGIFFELKDATIIDYPTQQSQKLA